MEWCPGREGRTSAIFSLATEKKVLICQQLYMDHIPVSLLKLLNMRIYRKLGPTPSLYVHKLGDDRVFFKGCRSIFFYFLTIFKKLLKENLPKPVRDLNFEIACDLFVAIKNVPERPGHNMRWDKPEFSDEEVRLYGHTLCVTGQGVHSSQKQCSCTSPPLVYSAQKALLGCEAQQLNLLMPWNLGPTVL